jgi:hypothetical protein
MGSETHKPSHGEWLEWAQVVVDRLTTCVHTYSKPPFEDVFMAEKERQEKNASALSLLHRIHGLIDDSETPTESLSDVAHHDERVIAGLVVVIRETVAMLPSLSTDMQKLLKSEWFDNCNGRLASELFRGPMGDLPRGIGSGYPEQGRLPAVLARILERERTGDGREPRRDLHRHDHAEPVALPDVDITPSRHEIDVRRRWGDKNRRSSGAVE